MKPALKWLLVALMLLGSTFSACSKAPDEEYAGEDEYYEEEEQGFVDRINKRAADEAVDYIQTPLNKARGVQDMAEQHVKDLEANE